MKLIKKIRAKWHNDIVEKQNDISAGISCLYVKANDTHTKLDNANAGIGSLNAKVDEVSAGIGGLYLKMDECIKLNLKLVSPPPPPDDFVFVSWGVICWNDDFKKYFLQNNMPEKIAKLKSNLDETSKKNIDIYLHRMLYLPDYGLKNAYKLSKAYLDSLQTEEEKVLQKEFDGKKTKYRSGFSSLSDNEINSDTFFFHHGLRFAANKVKEYIKNKDFIDGGAWIGDGVFILDKYYNPQKIYAFEVSPKNCELFHSTMKNNGITDNKYHLVPMGLSDNKECIKINDMGGQGVSAFRKGDTETNFTDLDSYVMDNNLNVGFIKTDLEGYGLKGLRGMTKTIKTYRPVLSLAIYHTTEEFFEMKPLLEDITKDINYKITLKKFDVLYDSTAEIALFAYPAELDEN